MRKGIMGYFVVLAIIAGFVSITLSIIEGNKRARAWYPIKRLSAECNSKKYEVYLMEHTKGWQSWPYFIDINKSKEVVLNESCVLLNIEKYPKWKGSYENDKRLPIQKVNTFVTANMERR